MSLRIAVSTDTHFNLAKPKKINDYIESILEKKVDALLITGDISESDTLHHHLTYLSDRINIPIYFILGNHDYYHSSIKKTNDNLEAFLKASKKKNLFWVTQEGVIKLTENTCLVGGENWWDGGYGDVTKQGILHELIMLQDYKEIEDIAIGKDKRLKKLQVMSEGYVKHFEDVLEKAFQNYNDVILITHVPPFKESCSYQSSPLKDDWLFHFCCRQLGDFLHETMLKRKDKNLTVLCGHTHDSTFYKPLTNLTVIVGSASYFKPKIYTVITID